MASTEYENIELFQFLWLNSVEKKDKEFKNAEQQLSKAIHYLKIFDDFNACFNYINNVFEQEKIVFIITDTFGETAIEKVNEKPNVCSIYVHCSKGQSNINEWSKKFDKIKGSFSELGKLVETLLREQTSSIRYRADYASPIEILTAEGKTQETSTSNLNGQFVTSQLLIDCLLAMPARDDDKEELVTLCKKFYASNKTELEKVEEFQKTYKSDRALWWYTRESFVYRLLNKALRVQDIELLFLFRFFIRDLRQQLKELQMESTTRVFRGQVISTAELNALKQSNEKFLSMNSFLSTSVDRRQAVSFLYSSTAGPNCERVIFEIELDPLCGITKPFANITERSYYNDEQEVLLMLGSTFRLIKIEQQEKFCVIQLALCNDDDNRLKATIDYVKQEHEEAIGQSSLFSLVVLLFKAGKYDKAEKFIKRLLKYLPTDHDDIPGCYHNFGMIANHQGHYEKSIEWIKKALEIYRKKSNPDDLKISLALNSLGEVYFRQGLNGEALKLFHEALEIRRKIFGDEHVLVAKCYHNIGNLYQQEKRLHEALEYHKKSFLIRQNVLPADHLDIGSSHHCLGSIYLCNNQPAIAMLQYNQALKIYDKLLPGNHSDIGMIHYNLGLLHAGQNSFQQAKFHFQKAKSIFQANLDPTHPFILTVEQDIRRVSQFMS